MRLRPSRQPWRPRQPTRQPPAVSSCSTQVIVRRAHAGLCGSPDLRRGRPRWSACAGSVFSCRRFFCGAPGSMRAGPQTLRWTGDGLEVQEGFQHLFQSLSSVRLQLLIGTRDMSRLVSITSSRTSSNDLRTEVREEEFAAWKGGSAARASGARGGLPALGGRLPPPEPPASCFFVFLMYFD